MAKKRKKPVDSGELLMFSFDEMLGSNNVFSDVEPARGAEAESQQAEMVNADSCLSDFDRERMVSEMLYALGAVGDMNANRLRLLAMESATMIHSGIALSGCYQLRSVGERLLDGYQLVAYYYCSFIRAFPGMADKMVRTYDSCYEEACRVYCENEQWRVQ